MAGTGAGNDCAESLPRSASQVLVGTSSGFGNNFFKIMLASDSKETLLKTCGDFSCVAFIKNLSNISLARNCAML